MTGIRTLSERTRCIAAFVILVLTAGVVLCGNLLSGSAGIPPSETVKILLGMGGSPTAESVLLKIRLPRALAAMLLGGALALSGYLLQTFFHNPIAGPFVLGVSSGAKLVVALTMIFAVSHFHTIHSLGMILAAFFGSILSLGLVLVISQKVKQMSMLVVCGVMIGYICSAVTDFVVTFAENSDIVNLHNWSMGSFSGTSMDNVKAMAAVVLPASVCVFCLSKPISGYQLGEDYAQNLGVNVKLLRASLILLSGVLSACVTAFAGPVSFVGIAVPHLMRRMFRTARPLILIPACFFGGSIFCMLCDMIARTAFSPTELSISTVTAIFGAPVVMVVMIRRRRGEP